MAFVVFPFFDSISAVIAYTFHHVSVQYANESHVTCMPHGAVEIATVPFPGSVGIVDRYGAILSATNGVATLIHGAPVSGAIGYGLPLSCA